MKLEGFIVKRFYCFLIFLFRDVSIFNCSISRLVKIKQKHCKVQVNKELRWVGKEGVKKSYSRNGFKARDGDCCTYAVREYSSEWEFPWESPKILNNWMHRGFSSENTLAISFSSIISLHSKSMFSHLLPFQFLV